MLTETIDEGKGSLEEEIGGTESGNDGKAGLRGAVEVGWEKGVVFGTEAGNEDKAGLIGVVEGGCVSVAVQLGKA